MNGSWYGVPVPGYENALDSGFLNGRLRAREDVSYMFPPQKRGRLVPAPALVSPIQAWSPPTPATPLFPGMRGPMLPYVTPDAVMDDGRIMGYGRAPGVVTALQAVAPEAFVTARVGQVGNGRGIGDMKGGNIGGEYKLPNRQRILDNIPSLPFGDDDEGYVKKISARENGPFTGNWSPRPERSPLPDPRAQASQPVIEENGDGDLNVYNYNISPSLLQQEMDMERRLEEAIGQLDESPGISVRNEVDRLNAEASMGAHVQQQTGLGAGNIADAFENPAVHSVEDAAAQTNQAEILDAKDLTELEKYEHPLKNEWVAGLPPYDGDLKPGEACVRDCKERVRIHDLECDEVRRRVVAKLKEMGCPSTAVAIPQKDMCS